MDLLKRSIGKSVPNSSNLSKISHENEILSQRWFHPRPRNPSESVPIMQHVCVFTLSSRCNTHILFIRTRKRNRAAEINRFQKCFTFLHVIIRLSDCVVQVIRVNLRLKQFHVFFLFKYSWLSLSRPRLSRITAYLEVKIWSLPIHENLTTDGKCRKEEKLLLRSNFSSFPQYFQYISNFKSQITFQFVKCG